MTFRIRPSAGLWEIGVVLGMAILPIGGAPEFPEDQVKPGASLAVDLPALGMSASSRGEEPVRARVVFPDDWDRQRKHPVFVQFHGSNGSNQLEKPWAEVFGSEEWIYLAIDYSVTHPFPSGLSNAAEVLEMLREVALLDEDRIVAGGNASGAYSICHGIHSGLAGDYDAFILVTGGTEQGRTATRLGKRPVLVIEGELDTEKRRQSTARLLNSLKHPDQLTHVVVEGMAGTWPPRDHPTKPDEVLRAEVVETIRKWLKQTGMVATEVEELGRENADPAALADLAAADEKAFRYAAALAGYRRLTADPASKELAEVAIRRILTRRVELLEKAAAMRETDPNGAAALLAKIDEVFGE